jgi:hypothetical protein
MLLQNIIKIPIDFLPGKPYIGKLGVFASTRQSGGKP